MARKSSSERRRNRFVDQPVRERTDAVAAPVESIADRVLSDIALKVQGELQASAVAVAMEVDGHMTCRARAGASAPDLGTPVYRDQGLTGACVSTGAVIICDDTWSDTRVDAALCHQLQIGSLVLVPLIHGGNVIGVIEAFSSERYGFDDLAVHFLQEVAQDIVTRIFGEDQLESHGPAQSAEQTVSAESQPGPPPLPVSEPTTEDDISSAVNNTAGEAIPSETPVEPIREAFPEPDLDRARSPRTYGLAIALAVVVVLALLAILYARYHASGPSTTDLRPQSAQTAPPDPLSELRSAAQAGDAAAEYKLAEAYKSGSGVPTDAQQANAWMLTAAEHGNADAQLEWARTVEAGEDPDLVQAYTWYVIAGQLGKKESEKAIRRLTPSLSPAKIAQVRYKVGETYLAGHALPRDPVNAYFWFALADWGGNGNAREQLQQLESQLTPAQLNKARLQASTWIRRHTASTKQ